MNAEGPGPLDHVRCVLFDLDGTLIDSVALILASFRYATETVLGRSMTDEALLRNVGMPLLPQMEILAPGRGEELTQVYREHNSANHDTMLKAYPDVPEVLDGLREKGYRLGVVTSKGTPLMLRGLERFGLAGRFDVLVSMDDVEAHKPDPEPLLFAASELGVEPAECAYVGDSPHDVAAALAAGMTAIGALWGAFPAGRVLAAGPHLAGNSMRDIATMFGVGRRESGPAHGSQFG